MEQSQIRTVWRGNRDDFEPTSKPLREESSSIFNKSFWDFMVKMVELYLHRLLLHFLTSDQVNLEFLKGLNWWYAFWTSTAKQNSKSVGFLGPPKKIGRHAETKSLDSSLPQIWWRRISDLMAASDSRPESVPTSLSGDLGSFRDVWCCK